MRELCSCKRRNAVHIRSTLPGSVARRRMAVQSEREHPAHWTCQQNDCVKFHSHLRGNISQMRSGTISCRSKEPARSTRPKPTCSWTQSCASGKAPRTNPYVSGNKKQLESKQLGLSLHNWANRQPTVLIWHTYSSEATTDHQAGKSDAHRNCEEQPLTLRIMFMSMFNVIQELCQNIACEVADI